MYKCITNDFKSMYYTCTLYMNYTLMLLAICCQQIGGYMSVANVNCTLYIGSWIYHEGGGVKSNHTILLQWLSSHHVILWSLPCPDVPEMFRLLGCYEMLYTVNVTQIIAVRLLWNVVCSKCHTDNFWTMYWGPVSGSHVARSSSVLYLTREG